MSAGRYSTSKSPQSNVTVEPFSFKERSTPEKAEIKHSMGIRSTSRDFDYRDILPPKEIYTSPEQKITLEKKYRVLEQEKLRVEAELARKIDSYMDTIAKLREDNESLRSELNAKTRELSEIQADREAMSQLNEHRNQSVSVLRKELASVISELNLVQEENQQLRRKNQELADLNKEITQKMKRIEDINEKQAEEIRRQKEHCHELERLCNKLQGEDRKLRYSHELVNRKNNIFIYKLREELTHMDEKIRLTERKRTEEHETLVNTETQIQKLTEANEKLKDEVEFYKTALDEEKRNHAQLLEKISDLEKTLGLRSTDFKKINEYISKSDSFRKDANNFVQEKVETLSKENSTLATTCMEILSIVKSIVKEDRNIKLLTQKFQMEKRTTELLQKDLLDAANTLQRYFS